MKYYEKVINLILCFFIFNYSLIFQFNYLRFKLSINFIFSNTFLLTWATLLIYDEYENDLIMTLQ